MPVERERDVAIVQEQKKGDRESSGGIAGLDNGVLKMPSKKFRMNSFGALLANGEDPNGLVVQTPNGTSRQDHKQQKTVVHDNTDRWTSNGDWGGDMSGN